MGKLSWFPKYIVGPALAAALGFWFVGPRLAGSKRFQSLVKEKASQAAESTVSPAESPSETTSAPGEPEVTVGVKPVPERPRSRRHRTRDEDL